MVEGRNAIGESENRRNAIDESENRTNANMSPSANRLIRQETFTIERKKSIRRQWSANSLSQSPILNGSCVSEVDKTNSKWSEMNGSKLSNGEHTNGYGQQIQLDRSLSDIHFDRLRENLAVDADPKLMVQMSEDLLNEDGGETVENDEERAYRKEQSVLWLVKALEKGDTTARKKLQTFISGKENDPDLVAYASHILKMNTDELSARRIGKQCFRYYSNGGSTIPIYRITEDIETSQNNNTSRRDSISCDSEDIGLKEMISISEKFMNGKVDEKLKTQKIKNYERFRKIFSFISVCLIVYFVLLQSTDLHLKLNNQETNILLGAVLAFSILSVWLSAKTFDVAVDKTMKIFNRFMLEVEKDAALSRMREEKLIPLISTSLILMFLVESNDRRRIINQLIFILVIFPYLKLRTKLLTWFIIPLLNIDLTDQLDMKQYFGVANPFEGTFEFEAIICPLAVSAFVILIIFEGWSSSPILLLTLMNCFELQQLEFPYNICLTSFVVIQLFAKLYENKFNFLEIIKGFCIFLLIYGKLNDSLQIDTDRVTSMVELKGNCCGREVSVQESLSCLIQNRFSLIIEGNIESKTLILSRPIENLLLPSNVLARPPYDTEYILSLNKGIFNKKETMRVSIPKKYWEPDWNVGDLVKFTTTSFQFTIFDSCDTIEGNIQDMF